MQTVILHSVYNYLACVCFCFWFFLTANFVFEDRESNGNLWKSDVDTLNPFSFAAITYWYWVPAAPARTRLALGTHCPCLVCPTLSLLWGFLLLPFWHCNEALWPKTTSGKNRFVWLTLPGHGSLLRELRHSSGNLKLKPWRNALTDALANPCLASFPK